MASITMQCRNAAPFFLHLPPVGESKTPIPVTVLSFIAGFRFFLGG